MATAASIATRFRVQDLTNVRRGKMVAVRFVGKGPRNHAIWEVRCDCGKVLNMYGTDFKKKRHPQCGCTPWKRSGIPLTPERFWALVQKAEGDACWIWQGGRSDSQSLYGAIVAEGRRYLAHRVAYAMEYGEVPDDLCVCHRCDNQQCVRPSHLFLGTRGDNNRDCREKGRTAKGSCAGSAKLTEEQAKEILILFSGGDVSREELARRFGVNRSTVGRIINGQYWSQAVNAELIVKGKPNPRLPREVVDRVEQMILGGMQPKEIVEATGVAAGSVRNICHRMIADGKSPPKWLRGKRPQTA